MPDSRRRFCARKSPAISILPLAVRDTVMEGELGQAAQQWINATLVWIGLAMVAGLTARALLPVRDRMGASATLMLGAAGSAAGLSVLSLILRSESFNPVNPVGLFASIVGACGILLALSVLRSAIIEQASEESET